MNKWMKVLFVGFLAAAGCSGTGLPSGHAGLCQIDAVDPCPAGYVCQCQNAGACGVGVAAYCVPSGMVPCDTSGGCPNGLTCTGCAAHGPTDAGPNECTVKICQ